MIRRKPVAAAMAALIATALTACSIGGQMPNSGSSDASSGVNTSDLGQSSAGTTEPSGDNGALASRIGNEKAPYRIDILAVEATSSKTTVRFRMTNLSDSEKVDMFHAISDRGSKDRASASLKLLVGPDLSYAVMETSDGKCSCSEDIEDIDPGQSIELSSDFPPIPENQNLVTVTFPFDGAFPGLPVTRS